MARSLEELQSRYNNSGKENSNRRMPMMHGPGGRRGPGMRGGGKPKNFKKTIGRLLTYVSAHKLKLFFVLLCMFVTAVTSLIGSYMLAPVITMLSLALFASPSSVTSAEMVEELLEKSSIELSSAERVAHNVITSITKIDFISELLSSKFAYVSFYILIATIILAIIYLISTVCSYIEGLIMRYISHNAIQSLRNDLFEKLQKLPVKYFDTHHTGEIMSRFTNDIDNIDIMLNNSLLSLVSGAITIIGTFTFMLTTNVWLTLVTVAFIPVFIRGGSIIGKLSSKHYVSQQAAIGAINGYIEETVNGQKVIKVFNHENVCEEEFVLLNEDLRDKQFNAQFWGGVMGPIMGNSSQVCYGITVGLGAVLMCTSGLTPGALTVFAGYSRKFSMPINNVSNQMSTIFGALAGAERVFAVMDADPEEEDVSLALETPISGDVVLNNVTFGYVSGKDVLKNISLYAHPGQKIAFVGSTGAGKTTVTNLLNRFYDINSGEITIDGQPIKNYKREYLRKNIAMVLQDTHLFTGTVMENIRYGRLDATDEEVIESAKTASAHSFIIRLENGYDTVLEGDGANLSQGQRQLLNIARAALSKAPILVLDEATSSVDTRTERHIEHGMDRLMKNRTTFVIAHRLSTVRNANAIMVLENGEIIERGTHDELLKLGGRYYELYTGKKELD